MKLKMRLEYSDKTPFFELKLFFQRPLENFLWTLCTCSRYLKGPPNLVLCVSKKIVTVRHTNTKILTKKTSKKNDFVLLSLAWLYTVDVQACFCLLCVYRPFWKWRILADPKRWDFSLVSSISFRVNPYKIKRIILFHGWILEVGTETSNVSYTRYC